ncbi:MAG: hypothetical protein IPK80_34950 [Nannocystis sp.]|nr:hypothetical protein [Nannocystis sp.]
MDDLRPHARPPARAPRRPASPRGRDRRRRRRPPARRGHPAAAAHAACSLDRQRHPARDACDKLRQEDAVALDVETTLYTRRLCLVQLGTREEIFIIDAFQITEFDPLAELLGDPHVVKIIHNATFEKRRAGAPRHHHHQHRRHPRALTRASMAARSRTATSSAWSASAS